VAGDRGEGVRLPSSEIDAGMEGNAEATAPHITQAEYEALAAFRYALRLFLRFSEEAALATGLTPQQHQALLAIQGFPERDAMTIGELAERLQVRHHSAVGLVDRLVAQGLTTRQMCETDRRQVLVRLTPQGVMMLERLSAVHRAELRRIGPGIAALLTRLSDNQADDAGKD
jgi:DNA-binding MarR family transcriptional regulator